jgi:hypothetical protein
VFGIFVVIVNGGSDEVLEVIVVDGDGGDVATSRLVTIVTTGVVDGDGVDVATKGGGGGG